MISTLLWIAFIKTTGLIRVAAYTSCASALVIFGVSDVGVDVRYRLLFDVAKTE